MAKKDWEIFHVKYQLPKFGTEGREFNPEIITMMVSTQGGPDDAKETCMRYHSGCKVVAVLDRLAAAVEDSDGTITKSLASKGKKK